MTIEAGWEQTLWPLRACGSAGTSGSGPPEGRSGIRLAQAAGSVLYRWGGEHQSCAQSVEERLVKRASACTWEGEKLSSVIWEPETPGADEADAEASSGRSISSCSGSGPEGGGG